MYWYNPKTRSAERVPTPATDAEAIGMLAGHPDSAAFVEEYERRRWEQGMEIEQAMIFVGHHFRLEHLLYEPVGRMPLLSRV
jgi:hypothetical protein